MGPVWGQPSKNRADYEGFRLGDRDSGSDYPGSSPGLPANSLRPLIVAKV
jgi:hypothetical protein